MVLYRKYRPQKIADLDLKTVRDRLSNIFSSGSQPHAFLFAGPKGTGKTSSARIIAKVINCQNRTGKNIEPCNECEACLAITAGRHMDILEIDAASNRGIDEIRELREKIKFAPVSAKFKVYIIDEVHMLTNEAFNALLKTLEEPPEHAVFILATTEAQKVPETIVSRCVFIRMQKATNEEIVHSLKRVVTGEKISISEKALEMLADLSEGSFRDATKYLEQAILEDALTEDKILAAFGRQNLAPEEFIANLIKKQTKETLEQLMDLSNQGADLKFFNSELLDILHRQLLAKYGIDTDKTSEELGKILTIKDIKELLQLFLKSYADMKTANRTQLPLEIAVVEWCSR